VQQIETGTQGECFQLTLSNLNLEMIHPHYAC